MRFNTRGERAIVIRIAGEDRKKGRFKGNAYPVACRKHR